MTKANAYILFIDESGKSEFSEISEHFILSGLLLDKDLHAALSSYMVSLKERSGIPSNENIHAVDLFEGERKRLKRSERKKAHGSTKLQKYKKIPYSRIGTFFNRLTSLIEGSDIRILTFHINKKVYQKQINRIALRKRSTSKAVARYLRRKQLDDFLYESLARKMILEFGHFLEKEDAYGEVMAESRRKGDEEVLRAFVAATNEATFKKDSRYELWAKSSFERIHSLTFQNKKGLSFGLEIADLFGWAYLNNQFGRAFPLSSNAKIRRVESRLLKVGEIMRNLYMKKPEDVTRTRLNSIAADKVSEFTKALKEYKASSVSSGTPPGNPGGP